MTKMDGTVSSMTGIRATWRLGLASSKERPPGSKEGEKQPRGKPLGAKSTESIEAELELGSTWLSAVQIRRLLRSS